MLITNIVNFVIISFKNVFRIFKKARGIAKRLSFEFYVDAYRIYDKTGGWKASQIEPPPNLDGIVLVLHAGEWKVASSPQQSYNLK